MRKTIATVVGMVVILGAALAGLSQHLFFAHADTPVAAAQLIQGVALAGPAAPANLAVHNDDHVATVSWQASTDSATVGYKITWGPTGSLTHSFFTPYTQAQIQPLDAGQTYQVEVQSVNGTGGLSAVVGPATAQTDPTYVNQLRQNMNGMFDDFNANPYQGQVDPTHWYTTYNNASPISMPFVFDEQHHLHMFLQNNFSNGDDDRASLTMRALRPFDFSNRTGTIAFDFDWGRVATSADGIDTGRYEWYLTLSPTEVDDINYDSSASGFEKGIYPLDAFQIFMDRDRAIFRKIQGGNVVQSWTADLNIDNYRLRTINVRKHSVFTVSQNSAQLTIDGTTVLNAAGINLDFQRAWVYNQQFQYNLPKDHVPFALSHWDNIGFDAPAGYAPDILHEYTDGVSITNDRHAAPSTWNVTIPDSLTGATTERLFLDGNTGMTAGVTAPVSVNGVSVPWPALPGRDNVAYDARVFELPVGTLHTGANTITVGAPTGGSISIQNVHVEAAFPAGSTAPYTPAPWSMASLGSNMQAMIPYVGPIPSFGNTSPTDGTTVSGTIPVEVRANGAYALLPTGHVDAVTRVSVDVDGTPAIAYVLQAPTVATDQTLMLDTSHLTNGQHTVTVTAYGADKNADGSPVSLNSDSSILHDHDTPSHSRRIITVANQGGTSSGGSPVQISTPTPTATLAALPVPAPLSINGVSCTVTINGVQKAGVCSGQFAPTP